ncbi:MAG: aminotransferase class I/II-fold pyridoxal phosphate-dependent enzyme, partial [Candidatus Methylomirabilales bacterium]
MEFLREELDRLKREDSYRWLRRVEGEQGPRMKVDGRDVVMLCSSNYLGLASHPKLKEAAMKAAKEYGTSASAARLISGNVELYERLEERLAAFTGREAALVYVNGYMANLGVIASVVGEGDLIISDELNHASIVDGCRLSKADLQIFPHNDVGALEEILKKAASYRRRLIVVDGLYSMDGDLAPLP